MAHVDSINIHHADRLIAKPMYSEGTAWVSLEFAEDGSHRQFRVSVFMDYARASRLANAINAAWPVPAAEDVPDDDDFDDHYYPEWIDEDEAELERYEDNRRARIEWDNYHPGEPCPDCELPHPRKQPEDAA